VARRDCRRHVRTLLIPRARVLAPASSRIRVSPGGVHSKDGNSSADAEPESGPWKIANLAALKRDGRLHLPDLQRGFVWSADRVRALHDSLYRSYPVGALLLWEPQWEGEAPFSTRAWDICPPDEVTFRGVPEAPRQVVPGSLFVLDGQQRLTSIFR